MLRMLRLLCSVADNHPRNSLETDLEQPEQPEHRARATLGGGLWFGAQVAQGAHGSPKRFPDAHVPSDTRKCILQFISVAWRGSEEEIA